MRQSHKNHESSPGVSPGSRGTRVSRAVSDPGELTTYKERLAYILAGRDRYFTDALSQYATIFRTLMGSIPHWRPFKDSLVLILVCGNLLKEFGGLAPFRERLILIRKICYAIDFSTCPAVRLPGLVLGGRSSFVSIFTSVILFVGYNPNYRWDDLFMDFCCSLLWRHKRLEIALEEFQKLITGYILAERAIEEIERRKKRAPYQIALYELGRLKIGKDDYEKIEKTRLVMEKSHRRWARQIWSADRRCQYKKIGGAKKPVEYFDLQQELEKYATEPASKVIKEFQEMSKNSFYIKLLDGVVKEYTDMSKEEKKITYVPTRIRNKLKDFKRKLTAQMRCPRGKNGKADPNAIISLHSIEEPKDENGEQVELGDLLKGKPEKSWLFLPGGEAKLKKIHKKAPGVVKYVLNSGEIPTQKEIADKLGIEVWTVKYIFNKIDKVLGKDKLKHLIISFPTQYLSP